MFDVVLEVDPVVLEVQNEAHALVKAGEFRDDVLVVGVLVEVQALDVVENVVDLEG